MKTKTILTILICTIVHFNYFSQEEIKFNKKLKQYSASLSQEFEKISEERKKTLTELGDYILEDKQKNQKVNLTFICTSNSRRSHLSQIWMQTACAYYGIDSIYTFSGGTEATEVNKRAISALERAGFTTSRTSSVYNTPYSVSVGVGTNNSMIYSKKYDNFQNPKSNFIAVMVCSEADKSCPIVPGSNGKIGLPYEDPKYYDNTPSEEQKYDETCRLIALELFFVADYVKTKLILAKEKLKK
jgi:arsenate reductase